MDRRKTVVGLLGLSGSRWRFCSAEVYAVYLYPPLSTGIPFQEKGKLLFDLELKVLSGVRKSRRKSSFLGDSTFKVPEKITTHTE